mmetsp:Transcript_2214/g.3257  ORF Transcript_2214/g.3257 Transcript_2214/m.3257 type:complete len:81 (+) Transcript_2214:699-941(+)
MYLIVPKAAVRSYKPTVHRCSPMQPQPIDFVAIGWADSTFVAQPGVRCYKSLVVACSRIVLVGSERLNQSGVRRCGMNEF